MGIKMMRSIA